MLPTTAPRSPALGLPLVAVLESVRYVLVPCQPLWPVMPSVSITYEDAWGLDSNTGKLTLSLIGEHPHPNLGKLASPLNMDLGKLTLSLT